VNLVARKFCFRQFAGDQRGPAERIHFLRMPQSLFERKNENLLQHLDHIVIRVVIVVEKNHLIKRILVLFPSGVARRFGNRRCKSHSPSSLNGVPLNH